MMNKENVLKYAEMMKNGSKSPIGFYTKNGDSQEGRHRALAAIELGCEKIPVIEFYELSGYDDIREYIMNFVNEIYNKYNDLSFQSIDNHYKSMNYEGISRLGYNDFVRWIENNMPNFTDYLD
jgi:hypothetical protein